MKKKYLFSLAVILTASALTGCGKDDSSESYEKYVTLGDYTGMTIDRIKTTVTDDDVQEEVQNDLYANADYTEVTDRAAQNGDTVNIDYSGKINGAEFDGGSDADFDLELGSGTFLSDFEDGIVGMKTGETKDITVTFPEDYDGELDGKTAVFSVTVNSITEVTLPEYNDSYVQDNYGFDTTAEFEASLKSDLQEQYDDDAQYTACADALTQAVDNASFDGYPQELYDTTKTQVESDNQAFAEQLGIEWTDLVGEDYDIEDDVLSAIHEKMVVYVIADKEKLTITDDELNSYIDDNWELYEYDSKDAFVEDNGEDALRYTLLYDKVLDFLGENNTFNDIDADDYYETEEDDENIDLNEEDTEAEETSETDTDRIEEESDTNA